MDLGIGEGRVRLVDGKFPIDPRSCKSSLAICCLIFGLFSIILLKAVTRWGRGEEKGEEVSEREAVVIGRLTIPG